MDRLGLGYDDLRAINPSIVYVTGSGFGPDGPYVDRPGQDLLIQSMSGLAAYGGGGPAPPAPPRGPLAGGRTAVRAAGSGRGGRFPPARARAGGRGGGTPV